MNKKSMTHNQFLNRLRKRCNKAGSLRKYAEHLKISPSYLSAVCNGVKPPSKAILRDFGLCMQKTVTYTFQENAQ